MILIETRENEGEHRGRGAIALFGVGLIGRSILSAIGTGAHKTRELPFSWNGEHDQTQELDVIQKNIFSAYDEDVTQPISRFDIVWAAGHAGFDSLENWVIPEVRAFEKVLSFSLQLQRRAPNARHSFHLISSAGGLFEGQKHVDGTNVPRPLRPYGHAKLQQERLLSRLPGQTRKIIYRLTSVYGFSGTGTRFGLVNTIIQNSVRRQSSSIFGNLQTIRDYVLVSDIGQFVAGRLRDLDLNSHIFSLASGKPTTIFEMLKRIEKIVGRKLFYTLDNVKTNVADMSFSPAILPQFWQPTDLETGLRKTVRSLMSSSLALAPIDQSQFSFRN